MNNKLDRYGQPGLTCQSKTKSWNHDNPIENKSK